jgi:hypothetical protein
MNQKPSQSRLVINRSQRLGSGATTLALSTASVMEIEPRAPDAVPRVSGAPQIRGLQV